MPELQLLKDLDWLEVAATIDLDTDADYRKALAELRKRGSGYLAARLGPALGGYIQANGGKWPTDASQLALFCDPPVEAALLERWEIVSCEAFSGQELTGDWVLTEKSAVDPEFDSRHWIDSPSSRGVGPYHSDGYQAPPSAEEVERRALQTTLEPVIAAFRLAHGGKEPMDHFQLQPYIANSAQQAALNRVLAIMNQPHR